MALSPLPTHLAQPSLWPKAGDSALIRAWPYLVFLMVHLLTGLVFLINRSPGGPPGWSLPPIDDTWVTLVYARSFAESLTFAYNPGIPEAGMTSPLWIVILGILFKPLSMLGVSLPGLSQAAGILLAVGASAFAYLIVKHITGMRLAGVLVGLIIAIDPTFSFAKTSGSEIALSSMLSLGAIWMLLRGRHTKASVLLGLVTLARPEGLLLVGVVIAGSLARRLWERESQQVFTPSYAQDLLLLAAPSAIAGAAWMLYNLSITGMPLPNSFYVLHGNLGVFDGANLAAIWTGYFQHTGYMSGFQPYVTFGVIAAGVYLAIKRVGIEAMALILFPLAIVYAMSIFALLPDDRWDFTSRQYLDSLLPYIAILIVLGMAAVWQAMAGYVESQRRLDPDWLQQLRLTLLAVIAVLALVSIGGLPFKWPGLASEYSWSARNVSDVSVSMADWIDANLPSDAVIAVDRPGALRFFADRPLIDLTGLSYHEGIGSKSTFSLFEEIRGDYLVVSNDLYVKSWPYGVRVVSFAAPINPVSSGTRLAVYESDWNVEFAFKHLPLNEPLSGLRLVDSLDVGNSLDEREHEWGMNPLIVTVERTFRTNANATVNDDARVTTGYESFRVDTISGKGISIIKRYDSAVRGAVRVFVDEQDAGVWQFPAREYLFGESRFDVPASFITEDSAVLRFEHIPDTERETNLNSFYYWIFVPTEDE